MVTAPVHFGMDTFMEGVDPTAEFYRRLQTADVPPTTSTPSPGDFLRTYERLANEATAIVSIHLMETKSTLINVARMAADMLPHVDIHVVDSRTTTLGLGLLTLVAARGAKTGKAATEIVTHLERRIADVHVHAAIRELTQLRRSGRVSLGQALVAGVLGIRPILYIGQGMAEVVDKVRGWPRAVERMVEMAAEKAGQARVALAVVHTNAEEEAHQLLEAVRERFNTVETFIADAGSAMATHAGPGALGIVTMEVD